MEQLLARFPKNVSLGLGYLSPIHKVALNSAIKDFETDPFDNPQIRIHVETSNTLAGISTKVDAALSVTAGNLPIPASATASIAGHFENTNFETHDLTIITVDKIKRISSYKNVTLADDALDLLKGNNDDLTDFFAKYGDGFIKSITYGNKVVIVLRTNKTVTQTLKALETKLAANVHDVKVAADLKVLREQLNTATTEDQLFISIGNNDFFKTKSDSAKQQDDGTESEKDKEDISAKLAEYLESESSAIIDYDKEYYKAVKNVKVKNAEKLSTLVASEYDFYLLRIDACMKKIHNSKILNNDNICDHNGAKEKDSDPYHLRYNILKAEATDHSAELVKIKQELQDDGIPTDETKRLRIESQLQVVERWYNANQEELKKVTNLTLVKMKLLEKNHEKTKAFELNLKGIGKETKFLYVCVEDEHAQTFQLMRLYGIKNNIDKLPDIGLFSCPTQQKALPATGCYFDGTLGQLKLGLKLVEPNILEQDTFFRIYAASERVSDHHIAPLNEKHASLKPLDGAILGQELVYEDTSGYMDYKSGEGSQSAKLQQFGLNLDETEEFDADTQEDQEKESSHSNGKADSFKPSGP